jgi:Zn-dependent protease
MNSLSLLGRTSNRSISAAPSSFIGLHNIGSLSTTQRLQHKRHPFSQNPGISPAIGSIATFSSQNNLTPRPPPNRRGIGNIVGMAGTGALVLFGKTKYVLAALKLTKLAPLGSMLFTVGTYSMFFGLPYAAGMVGLILVHEIGHAAVMHSRGVPFSPMVFIPFMGAVIATKELPRDAWEDALIAFGGPVLGSLGAGAVGLAGHATDSQLLIALADFGLMINLFNLLPLGSMDGGRIAGALSPYMSVAGVGMGAGLAYTGAIQNPIFYLILLSGGYQTFQRFYNPGAMPANYYSITPFQRASLGLGYVGLISGLALAMDLNGRYKKSPEVLKREMELEKTWDMR